MATNEQNAREIVWNILTENPKLGPLALTNRIIDSLAEVELIVDEFEEP